MRNCAILIGLFLLATPFSTLAEPPANEEPNLGRGASLYSSNCARCHNARGANEFSDAYWPMIVTHMRVIGGLPGDQAREIEAFLRASNNPPRPQAAVKLSAAPSTALSGEDLVQQYGCQGCHRIEGAGGSVGPNLDGVFERRDEEWVRLKILHPRQDNPRSIMPEFGLTEAQVSSIIEMLKRPE